MYLFFDNDCTNLYLNDNLDIKCKQRPVGLYVYSRTLAPYMVNQQVNERRNMQIKKYRMRIGEQYLK